MDERRKTERFSVTEDAYVFNHESSEKIGKIIDISRGGLAFRYIGTRFKLENTLNLSIFQKGRGLAIENVMTETISDLEIVYENPLSQIPLRRRGVQFCLLTPQQAAQLVTMVDEKEEGENN